VQIIDTASPSCLATTFGASILIRWIAPECWQLARSWAHQRLFILERSGRTEFSKCCCYQSFGAERHHFRWNVHGRGNASLTPRLQNQPESGGMGAQSVSRSWEEIAPLIHRLSSSRSGSKVCICNGLCGTIAQVD